MFGILRRILQPYRQHVQQAFFEQLLDRSNNFGTVTWLGAPIWQNVLDLWTIQETIAEIRPDLLIECGTNRGGSAIFYGHLMDIMDHGRIISVDVERLHERTHPRVTFLIGSSTSDTIVDRIRSEVRDGERVMVILDSDHSAAHVLMELERYADLVSSGSYVLVQDGVIDTMPRFAGARPGPLVAVQQFLATHPEFEVDNERVERFLITHHPSGWLRKIGPAATTRQPE